MIIPAFNHERSVAAAVHSALVFDEVDEVIVIDDGSDDGTAAAVEGMTDPRVRLLRQANRGPGAARNAGARSAASEHLVFLDADDVLMPGSVPLFVLQHGSGSPLVRTGATRADSEGQERVYLAQASPFPYPRGAPLAGSFSMERSLFDSIGGYDEELRYGENSELLLKAQSELMNVGKSVAYRGESTVLVRVNPAHDVHHYRERRLAAIERMFCVHRRELASDLETRHNHHAIASVLYQQEGERSMARRHGWAALRLRPLSVRSWGRLARAIVKPPTPVPPHGGVNDDAS